MTGNSEFSAWFQRDFGLRRSTDDCGRFRGINYTLLQSNVRSLSAGDAVTTDLCLNSFFKGSG